MPQVARYTVKSVKEVRKPKAVNDKVIKCIYLVSEKKEKSSFKKIIARRFKSKLTLIAKSSSDLTS